MHTHCVSFVLEHSLKNTGDAICFGKQTVEFTTDSIRRKTRHNWNETNVLIDRLPFLITFCFPFVVFVVFAIHFFSSVPSRLLMGYIVALYSISLIVARSCHSSSLSGYSTRLWHEPKTCVCSHMRNAPTHRWKREPAASPCACANAPVYSSYEHDAIHAHQTYLHIHQTTLTRAALRWKYT